MLLFILTLLTLNIDGQDIKTNKLYMSFTWAPVYYGHDNLNFSYNTNLPLAFETNIYYRFIKELSISTGIGFQGLFRSYDGWKDALYSPTYSQKTRFSQFRIPLQINYYFTTKNDKVNPYIKSEIAREFDFAKESFYKNEIFVYLDPYKYQYTLINLGFGIYYPFTQSIMLINEYSVGTNLNDDGIFNSFHIKIKLGILLK
jgi:hypothetical protein